MCMCTYATATVTEEIMFSYLGCAFTVAICFCSFMTYKQIIQKGNEKYFALIVFLLTTSKIYLTTKHLLCRSIME